MSKWLLRQLEIIAQRAPRLDALILQGAVISLHRLFSRDRSRNDFTHETDDFDRRFGEVDLPAKQRDAGAVFLRLAEELEGVPGRARGTAKDADDQPARLVGR